MLPAMATTNGHHHRQSIPARAKASPEHLDVLIVGAGLSGIGAACRLSREHPGKSFAVLESRRASGGTWDLFRYPGIRSDSDMFTMSYPFRPWRGTTAIADGASFLDYLRETARERGVSDRIRYNRRVVAASWSGAHACWRVEAERTDTGEREQLTCGFLLGCTGYYRYDEGHAPVLAGRERFAGRIVHPQHWPEDLDHEGSRVVVIGSGATAMTLVPALAGAAAHVTMLQRSPSYVLPLPTVDPLARALRWLPARLSFPLVRWKNILLTAGFYRLCRRFPRLAKEILRGGVTRRLPPGYAVDTHFGPRYEPWDQRLCIVPDGDLFEAIGSGDASVVTGEIETLTEGGLLLASGQELEADLIVTATGLNLLPLGGIELRVDGRRIELADTVAYKGLMLGGIPNFAFTIGYTNASWTLKADLVAVYVCRLLGHMDRHGRPICTPRPPDSDAPTAPLIELSSGYITRAIGGFPRQGRRTPWRLHQSYRRDRALLRRGAIEDEAIEFSSPRAPAHEEVVARLEAARLAGHPGAHVHAPDRGAPAAVGTRGARKP